MLVSKTLRGRRIGLAGHALTLRAAALAGAAFAALSAAPALAADVPAVHPALWPKAASPGLVDPATEARITALLAAMSDEEKVGQIVQADIASIKAEDLRTYPLGSILAGGNSGPDNDDRAPAKAWLDLSKAFRAISMEKRPGHEPIPIIFGVDAVHGHNNVVGATVFPHNVGLGATRDPDLIRRIGKATAEELAVTGVEWTFGPTVTTPQDVRWGRSYEGYSEDPEVVRAYSGHMVEGLQGRWQDFAKSDVIQRGHVAASAKHFLADGGTTDGKDQGDAAASEEELIKTHAQGYPPAIDAGVMTVMASYSSWRGIKMHGNRGLLTDVLKGRMGFQGFVVGDWNGHGQIPGCTNESCAASINAGLDMFMAPDSWKGLYKNTLAQVKSGEISKARLDDAVRRILRVKYKMGAFDAARPYEGRLERLGAPEHRAIAREAVRKSLVLLKNDGVLPIRGKARILVAGDGADDIGKQSGGWTLSWQGAGNKNTDFPNGQSIFAGIKEAVAGQGGSATLSVDGSFNDKPDVAIVVFGENPYAEFQGDRATLDYQPGAKTDLAMLRKLKAAGVPVVSVFISGRPMWVNPEINASDAFVAAWLPGTEGAGVADVLIGSADGKPRHDFTGKLSFSWPKTAIQTPLNRGMKGYDPQFAFGYGLSYAAGGSVAKLGEDPGVDSTATGSDVMFAAGRIAAPWRLSLTSGGASAEPIAGQSTIEIPGKIAMRTVDAEGVQERGRAFDWTGADEASVNISGPPSDLMRQTNGDMAIAVRMQVTRAGGAFKLVAACDWGCAGAVDLTRMLSEQVGQWRTVKIKLSCFKQAGADMAKFSGLSLAAKGPAAVTVSDIRLATNDGDAVCPAG
jgi:beta-glucosidase